MADKRERRRRGRKEEEAGADTMLSVWAARPAGAREQVKGPRLWSSPAPTAPLPAFVSPTSTAAAASPPLPPAGGLFFMGDETAGLLGQAGLGIRIRLARVGWQMAA